MQHHGSPRPPSAWRLAIESRAVLDTAELLLRTPRLARLPRGDGSPVLVIPGFATSDALTVVLRRYLRHLGYDAHGWGLGMNRGDVPALVPRVMDVTRGLGGGRPIALVGWSLGGVLAREVAREEPQLVRRIVTMGTPVVGGPKYTATSRSYRAQGADLDAIEALVADRNRVPIRVPITAIYSRNDGVVDWRACIDHHNPVEHVEVRASHLGMGSSGEVFEVIARRLAEPVQPSG